jgi:hypothetical protein
MPSVLLTKTLLPSTISHIANGLSFLWLQKSFLYFHQEYVLSLLLCSFEEPLIDEGSFDGGRYGMYLPTWMGNIVRHSVGE